jgi:hypothetical protein
MQAGFTRRRFLGTATAALATSLLARSDELESDEEVLFLPALGTPAADGAAWNVEFRAVVYERERRRLAEAALRELLGEKIGELSAAEQRWFTQRVGRFLHDHERGKEVTLEIGGRRLKLGKSRADGRVQATVRMSPAELGGAATGQDHLVSLTANLATDHTPRRVTIPLLCLAARGMSVVSDVDDTIKVTQVRDRAEMLRNTFCRPFVAVDGMAAPYARWAARGASFHYLSGSPWQLFEPLQQFAAQDGFPQGSWHLREFRPKSRQTLQLAGPPATHKRAVLVPLFQRLPERRFILVGDSGEHDPEIYGAMARRFPTQVTAVLIRDVTSESAAAPRYREAFREVDPARWQIFREPGEVGEVWQE